MQTATTYCSAPDDVHAHNAAAFVELNPVRAGIAAPAWDLAWSSAAAHYGQGRDPARLLDLSVWSEVLSPAQWKATLGAIADPVTQRLRLHTRTGRPLGSDSFLSTVETYLGRRVACAPSPRQQRRSPAQAPVTAPLLEPRRQLRSARFSARMTQGGWTYWGFGVRAPNTGNQGGDRNKWRPLLFTFIQCEERPSRNKVRPMNETMKFKIASILFRVTGYGGVALAAYFVIANTVFWVRSESATGEVVGWEAMEGMTDRRHLRHSISPAKATVVEFKTSAGDTVIFASEVGSGLDLYETGEEVTVLYFEDDPQNAKLRGFFSLYMGPILLAVMGGVFVFVGVLLQFFYEPRPANRPA